MRGSMLRRFSSSRCSAPECRAILAVALVAVLTLPGVTRRLYASDEVEYVAFLRSLWFDGDLSFDNEYRHFYAHGAVRDPGFAETFIEPTTETGLKRTFGTIGSALLWAPFYAVADAGTRIAIAMGSDVAADGYSAPYISAICIGSAVYGLLALLLAWYAARRVLRLEGIDSLRHPAIAAAAVGLRHAPALLHVRRAGIRARDVRLRGIGLHPGVADRAGPLVGPRAPGARRPGRPDGDGPGAGRLHRRGPGPRPRLDGPARAARARGRRTRWQGRRHSRWRISRRRGPTSSSTGISGRRAS